MKTYHEQLALAQRFDRVVDFGSPMSAWTPTMLAQRAGENMKTGTLNRDVEHYNPSCNARGTLKAGTRVHWITKKDKKSSWSSWIVTRREDVPFMCDWDWRHHFVDVPADAVTETP